MRTLSHRLVLTSILALPLLAGGCGARSLVAVREAGDAHMERREYAEAVEDYKEYVDRSPGNPEIHMKLSRAYLALNQTGMAREQGLLAQSLAVEDPEVFAAACQALYADKRYEQLNRLLRARTIDRGRMDDFMLLGSYSERLGDVDEAQRAYLTAAQVTEGADFRPHLALARLYDKVGDTRRRSQRLAMAYWAAPNEPEVIEEANRSGEIPGPTFGVIPPEAGGKPMQPAASINPSKPASQARP